MAAKFWNARKRFRPSMWPNCTAPFEACAMPRNSNFVKVTACGCGRASKADIFDIALNGKIAIVESVERDFEDRVHLAVTVEDDPGRDLRSIARQIGHRFFFSPEEVELV